MAKKETKADMIPLLTNTINEDYAVREVQHQGRTHIVVPVIMMKEGVHAGSAGPLLHPATELGHFPESWNVMPVVIDHPKVDGVYVSANSPNIIDGPATVGHIFNTHMNGSRLMAEAWLDKEKLTEISPTAMAAIENREPLDVSVGVFTDEEPTAGDWSGEAYTAIARNHRPDHLALLPGGTGACSWEDGCGVRANEKKGGKTDMNENTTVTDMEGKRKELGMTIAEFYAIPRDPPSESKLPIFDEAHVRNALARFNQVQGVSSEEKASAKSKILAKAKHFGIDAAGLANNLQKEVFEALESAKEVGLDSELEVNAIKFTRTNFNINKKEVKMAESKKEPCGQCMEKVVALISNAATKYTEADRVWLMNLEESQLDQMFPVGIKNHAKKTVTCAKCGSKMEVNIDPEDKIDGGADEDTEDAKGKKVQKNSAASALTAEQILQALSAEDRAAMEYGKKQMKARRDSMISGIQANTSKEIWPDETLAAMNEDTLERIYNSVKKVETPDFSLNGGISRTTITDNASVEPMLPAGVELKK